MASTTCPYSVLGVAKDATAAEIRSSYRKLVLKCHPDKVQDEAKRSEAVDVFQRVQEAYELLSDEAKRAKYDQKTQFAEQKKAAASEAPAGAAFRTTTYEYRGGKLYEEKTFTRSYDDSEEEPRVSSRKYERKSSSRDNDEKKKSKAESRKEASRSSKERVRENIRSSRSDRAKTRDKERKREQSDKHSRTAYIPSDDSESDRAYERYKSSRSKPTYEPVREPKPKYESSPKYIYIEDNAYDYIQRQKAGIPEQVHERRPSAPVISSHAVYYQTVDGDIARRSSARPARPTRGDSARSSIDHRDSYDAPSLRTSRKSPSPVFPGGIRVAPSPRGSASRSQTAYPVRTVKEVPTLRRSETAPLSSTTSRRPEPISRSSRTRERYDSGYSSPGTPEMYGTSPTKSSRFTVVEPDDYPPSHRVVMADTSRRHHSVSPTRRTPVPIRTPSRPAQLRAARVESSRVIPTVRRSSPPPSRRGSTRDALFGELRPEYHEIPPDKIRSSPRIRQEDIRYSPHKVSYQPTTVLPKGSYAY